MIYAYYKDDHMRHNESAVRRDEPESFANWYIPALLWLIDGRLKARCAKRARAETQQLR